MSKTLKKICELLKVDYIELMGTKKPYKEAHKALLVFCYLHQDARLIDLVNTTSQKEWNVRSYIREANELIKTDTEFQQLVEAFECVEA